MSPGCPLWLPFPGPLPIATFGIDPYGLCRLCSKSSLSTMQVGHYLFLPFPSDRQRRRQFHSVILPTTWMLCRLTISILNQNTICLAHTKKHQTLPPNLVLGAVSGRTASIRQPWCSLDKGVGRKVAFCSSFLGHLGQGTLSGPVLSESGLCVRRGVQMMPHNALCSELRLAANSKYYRTAHKHNSNHHSSSTLT